MKRLAATFIALLFVAGLCHAQTFGTSIEANPTPAVLPPAKITNGLILEWVADDYTAGQWTDRVSGAVATSTVAAQQPTLRYWQGKLHVYFKDNQGLTAVIPTQYVGSDSTFILRGVFFPDFVYPTNGSMIYANTAVGAPEPTRGGVIALQSAYTLGYFGTGTAANPTRRVTLHYGATAPSKTFSVAVIKGSGVPLTRGFERGVWYTSADSGGSGLLRTIFFSHYGDFTGSNVPEWGIRNLWIYSRALSGVEIQQMFDQP